MSRIIAETDRLLVREMNVTDVEALFQLHTIEPVMRYIGMPMWRYRSDSEDYLTKNLLSYRAHGFGRWVVELKSSGEWLGLAGLIVEATDQTIDLGYRFHPQFWGNGFATESVAAVLSVGFGKLQLPEIHARVARENKSSVRVIEKSGFEFSGETICMSIPAYAYKMDHKRFQTISR